MAKPRTTGQNLTRLEESLSGVEIEKLNELSPGLGAKIHKLISNLGNIQAAQAGHSGTVVLAKQERKDPKGDTPDSMALQGGRIGEVANAIRDDQVPNWGQVKSLFTCEYMAEILEDCIEDHLEERRQQSACAQTNLTNPKTLATGLTALYGVHAQNEFVVVTGDDGALGYVRVYRIAADNSFVQVGTLTIANKEEIQNTALQGRFLYCVGSALSTTNILTVVDALGIPNAPSVVASFNIGANGFHVYPQGRFVFIAAAGGIKIVDVSVPSAPVVRGFAT